LNGLTLVDVECDNRCDKPEVTTRQTAEGFPTDRPSFDFEVNHKRAITSGRRVVNYSDEICKYPDILMLASDFCWAVKNAPLDLKSMEIISDRHNNRHLHHHKINDVIGEAKERSFSAMLNFMAMALVGMQRPAKKYEP
jgi:hypothetical protein